MSHNLYQFSAELFCDIGKVADCWVMGRFNILSTNFNLETGYHVVLVELPNTDLGEIKAFLKSIENDMDTHVVTETIAEI